MDFVPSCLRCAVIYLALVTIDNSGTKGNALMAQFKVSIVVGSNRRDSINKKLAQALAYGAEVRFVGAQAVPAFDEHGGVGAFARYP